MSEEKMVGMRLKILLFVASLAIGLSACSTRYPHPPPNHPNPNCNNGHDDHGNPCNSDPHGGTHSY